MGVVIMRIINSSVSMSSQHQLSSSYAKQESLHSWQGNQRVEQQNQDSNRSLKGQLTADRMEISHRALSALRKAQAQAAQTNAASGTQGTAGSTVEFKLSQQDQKNLMILKKFLKALTGKDFDFQLPDGSLLQDNASSTPTLTANAPQVQQAQAQPEKQGWGLSYDMQETYQESEKMSFAANGTVQTADGKQIDFNVQLNMSREFAQQNEVHIREGDAKLTDPLVINYGGAAADLTEPNVQFDLNADGKVEQMPFVKAGSGFLALDKNNDGVINNGKELFGVASGNGFADLAAYDDDKNGWIDENDAVYSKLKIWSKDAAGADQLIGLKAADVGAIGLTNADASFSLKDSNNSLLGQSRTAGVFLKDSGGAGTVQQVDLRI